MRNLTIGIISLVTVFIISACSENANANKVTVDIIEEYSALKKQNESLAVANEKLKQEVQNLKKELRQRKSDEEFAKLLYDVIEENYQSDNPDDRELVWSYIDVMIRELTHTSYRSKVSEIIREMNKATAERIYEESKSKIITKTKFDSIKIGMTYDEVVEIIGSAGELISEAGSPGEELHTVMYMFYGENLGSNASFMFQGGKLINKAQFGL